MHHKDKSITRNPVQASVVSVSKDQTTVKVSIARVVPNKMYGKRLHLNTYLLADCKGISTLQAGDVVKIIPCKKVSKRKSWRVLSTASK